MPISEKTITLENLKEGAGMFLFNEELKKVLENLNDENTTDGVRNIKLSVKFKPDKKNRDFVAIDISCSSTLAPSLAVSTRAAFTLDEKGDPELNEFIPQEQTELDGFSDRRSPGEDPENVTRFPEANEA